MDIYYIKNLNFPYVYIGTHKHTKEFYIGYREKNKVNSSKDFGIKYKTTSSSTLVKEEFDNFDWIILAEFFTETGGDDAYWFEQGLIKENIKNPLCLNKHYIDREKNQKRWSSTSKETRKKISQSKKGRNKNKTYEEIYGVEKAAELKQMRSERMKEMRKTQINSGIPNHMKDKKRPQYVIDAIIKSRKESKGKWFWITNGSINKKIRKTDEIPYGFRPGRDPSFLKK